MRLLFLISLVVVLAFAAAVAATRFWLVPNADQLRPRVVETLSRLTGQSVALGRLSAQWNGWSPEFRIERLQWLDRSGRVVLELPRVDAALSWRSLLVLEPRLAMLVIHEPRVVVRRTRENALVVAGIDVNLDQTGGDARFADWLLRQRQVQLIRGEVIWLDEWRNLPPLRLSELSARLVSRGAHHRAGLIATPSFGASESPSGSAARPLSSIDLRVEFHGETARSIAGWDGSAYLRVPEADLAQWSRYLPLPVSFARGRGAFQAWFDFDDGAPVAITADVKAVEPRVLLPETGSERLAPLEARDISGRLSWRMRRATDGALEERWSVRDVRLLMPDGAQQQIGAGELVRSGQRSEDGGPRWQALSARLDQLDLGIASRVATSLPVPQAWRRVLSELSVRGQLGEPTLELRLTGQSAEVSAFSARFEGIGWNPRGTLPGVVGVSGQVWLDADGGRLVIESPRAAASESSSGRSRALWPFKGRKAAPSPGQGAPQLVTFTAPAVWPQPHTFTQLAGTITWRLKPEKPVSSEAGQAASRLQEVRLEALRFATAHASGRLEGVWQPDQLGPGIADLRGTIEHIRIVDIPRYLPSVLDPSARRWVEEALLDGRAEDIQFNIKGALWHFPFRSPSEGAFEVRARVEEATVDYADHWPRAERVDATVVFSGPSLMVKAQRGLINATPVGPVEVRVADLGSPDSPVEVRGFASAPLERFFDFAAKSPVEELLEGFTRGASGSGPARLVLEASFPRSQEGKLRLAGEFIFDGNRVELGGEVPRLDEVKGRLAFTASSVRDVGGITATAFGAPVSIDLTTEGHFVRVRARSTTRLANLAGYLRLPLLESLDGSADWMLAMNVPRGTARRERMELSSDIQARLRPLSWPLDSVFAIRNSRDASSPPIDARITRAIRRDGGDRVELTLAEQLHVVTERSAPDAAGLRRLERALVELGSARGALPARGIVLRGEVPRLDFDAALAFWQTLEPQLAASVGRPAAEASAGASERLNVNLRAKEMLVFGHLFHDVTLRAQPSGQRWRLAVTSREASGSIAVETGSQGDVEAVAMRLTRLSVPARVPPETAVAGATPARVRRMARWPRLEVVAEAFFTQAGVEWGRLELKAQPGPREWRIEELRITNPEGSILGRGLWRLYDGSVESDRTELAVSLKWQDAGQFLRRLGFAGGVERAAGSIEGQFRWPGSPADYSHRSALGEFTLTAGEGRFTQMEPGLAKLLGILSLQSLPRRLMLSFDDLFGRGFAFDTVEARVAIRDGMASTEGLNISGPSARVEIRGTADIERETQLLRVRVYPSLSTATAIGVGLATANPALGAAVYIGQKLARDPIERLLMQEFEIRGTWAEPIIQTKSTTPPEPRGPGG
ncbi:MAG: DUF3971 domain-containing protein [Casimicrobiaceae bacterium]|nr:DUF3971 domain-containing protein [Casimicrobiaceae bacterium]MDW8312213.1 AsmA-like C-terminal region-containing protein [Burkholderiales bacterium]